MIDRRQKESPMYEHFWNRAGRLCLHCIPPFDEAGKNWFTESLELSESLYIVVQKVLLSWVL